LLLQGLAEAQPPERWILWGPPEVSVHAWQGAEQVLVTSRPNQLRGQRDWARVPQGDLVVFLHQQRPLRSVHSLTTILDTTPLRFNQNRLDGWAKAWFLRRVGRISEGIITISEHSRRCIERDLGVDPHKITKIGLPADPHMAARVLALRERSAIEDVALYVGLFLAHKNLPRLVEAFDRTAFRRRGGRLVLVGGKDLAEPFRRSLDRGQRASVDVRRSCDQAELERLYATSRLLVQPSLEEGFGLPVQEALASGLPACASSGGALPEVTLGLSEHFDPLSIEAMAMAIDRTAERATDQRDHGRALSAAYLARSATVAQLTDQVRSLVARHLP
jgi:glycosyltransferase involved in cell wall biosynthesis